jgi:ubiquinone/menaquinone biosynthesis C-methylase UbiE
VDKKRLLTYYRRQSVDRERMYAKPLRRYQQRRRLEVVRELVLERWRRLRSGLLLDVGCGDGYGIATIVKELDYALLVGLDLSPQKLRAAGRVLPASRMILGDAQELPLVGGSFQAVFSLETLEHLMAPQRAIAEIARVLKPGGSLFISIPVSSALNAWAAGKLMRFRRRGKFHEHIQFYSSRRITEMLRQAGLKPAGQRLCVFNYPCFELLTRIIPYRIWRRLDDLLSRMPLGFVGFKFGLSFGVGSEYLVVHAIQQTGRPVDIEQ